MSALRRLAECALSKNLHSSAILLSEQLLSSPNCSDSDIMLCAKCYYCNGEPRRSLSLLERKGLLSNEKLSLLTDNFKSLPSNDSFVDSIQSILLASQCLYLLGQYEDCVSLLGDSILSDENTIVAQESMNLAQFSPVDDISPIAALYSLFGKALDRLDNRSKSLRSLILSIELDPGCIESVEYIVQNSMLSDLEMLSMFNKLESSLCEERKYLLPLYQSLLKVSYSCHSQSYDIVASTKSADQLYSLGVLEDSYRFSRYAYTLDPYNYESIATYVASMVELKQSTELFYLSHELIKSHPKQSISWYAIGCYYWTITKYIPASKYFQKAIKVDKRFANAWVMLAHTLSAQEESEHAISSYRTALRLLPNDHRPSLYMAKELLKSNYIPLAIQVLLGCYESQPLDQLLLNEIGVAYLKVCQPQISIDYFEKSMFIERCNSSSNHVQHKSFESSLLCNYATALRKCNKYEDSLFWYAKCLSLDPLDHICHVGMGFTYHLMQHFQSAVACYHKALAIQSNSKLSVQLLNQAMEDSKYYKDCGSK